MVQNFVKINPPINNRKSNISNLYYPIKQLEEADLQQIPHFNKSNPNLDAKEEKYRVHSDFQQVPATIHQIRLVFLSIIGKRQIDWRSKYNLKVVQHGLVCVRPLCATYHIRPQNMTMNTFGFQLCQYNISNDV
jgi:hypothetical protein